MKNKKTNIILKFTSFTVAVISCMLVFFYAFQFVPMEKKLLKENLYVKANTIFYLYGKPLTEAIETRDDLTLISKIENIMKIDDIKSAYVLDNSGKVITHDKTSQWGKILNDEISKKAVNKKTIQFQESIEQRIYLFSAPLTSSATLCISFSNDKINTIILSFYKDILYKSLIVLFCATILLVSFIYFRILIKIKKIKHFLTSIKLSGEGKIPVKENDDFWELSSLINEVVAKIEEKNNSHSVKADESNNNEIYLLKELCSYFNEGIIILDSNYKIISANTKAKGIFEFEGKEILGKHILDIIKNGELIELIKKSYNNPSKNFEIKQNNLTVNIKTLSNEKKEPQGTIILSQ